MPLVENISSAARAKVEVPGDGYTRSSGLQHLEIPTYVVASGAKLGLKTPRPMGALLIGYIQSTNLTDDGSVLELLFLTKL